MLYKKFLKNRLLDFINKEFSKENSFKPLGVFDFSIEIPSNKNFGDISTNIAMVLSKKIKLKTDTLAKKISNDLMKNNFIDKVEVLGPGFVNIFFKDYFWQEQLKELISKVDDYEYDLTKKNICLEFVSANPTGLMHVGHARGAVLGDTISSILEEVGHSVIREYYINDAGEQIKKLIKTLNFHENNRNNKNAEIDGDLYPGEYLKKISLEIKDKDKNIFQKPIELEEKVLGIILADIKDDLFKIKVKHDSFVSEKKISKKKNIDAVLKKLEKLDLSYLGYQEKPKSINDNNNEWEKKKQLLFRSSNLGDDMDRALLKPSGELTYFMSDIVYHQNKINRDYDILLNIWGSDHSGYVKRLENALKELNKNKKYNFQIKLTSLVNLLEGKKIIKMSKREGNYITLRDVIEKVGPDVLRFIMISRNADKKIDFDFELLKSKSKDNPVFYVQYAFARCISLISIFNKTFDIDLTKMSYEDLDLSNLSLPEEKNLIKKLCNYFNIISLAAQYYEPHRITNYLYDLAKDFHAYWGGGKIDENKKIILEKDFDKTKSRITLIFAVSKIIKKSMNILKINCPENM